MQDLNLRFFGPKPDVDQAALIPLRALSEIRTDA
jgi:hypothetical protein